MQGCKSTLSGLGRYLELGPVVVNRELVQWIKSKAQTQVEDHWHPPKPCASVWSTRWSTLCIICIFFHRFMASSVASVLAERVVGCSAGRKWDRNVKFALTGMLFDVWTDGCFASSSARQGLRRRFVQQHRRPLEVDGRKGFVPVQPALKNSVIRRCFEITTVRCVGFFLLYFQCIRRDLAGQL